MKKRMFILVLMVTLIACTNAPEKTGQFNFKQGTAEVNMRLLDGNPPEKIYPNSPFSMVVELDNQAAYDLVDGKLSVVGLDHTFLEVTPEEESVDTLFGKSLTAPSGEKKFIEFKGQAHGLFQNAEEYRGIYFLKLRYNTALDFVDTICVNPSPYTIYDAGCTVQSKKTYSGQGGPFAVTEVEEIMILPDEIELRLHLRNRGQGQASFIILESARLGDEDISNCQFQEGNENSRTLQLTAERQEVTVVCRHSLKETKSYTTSLALRFQYGYEVKQEHFLRLVK